MDYYKADPSPEMLESSQFQAIWQIIKNWDIGFIEGPPSDRMEANGNHVAMILHALATPPESKQFQHQADNWRKEIRECDAKVDEAYRQGALEFADRCLARLTDFLSKSQTIDEFRIRKLEERWGKKLSRRSNKRREIKRVTRVVNILRHELGKLRAEIEDPK